MCEVCAKVHSRHLRFGGEFGFSASRLRPGIRLLGFSASRLRPGIRLLGFSASRLLGFVREFGFSASRLPPPSAGPLYHRPAFCVAGAVFGDLGVSVFVAGAVFGEIWVDSRSAKCCNFQYKMRCRGGKSKLCERTGSVLQFHGRIMFGSCSNRPRIGNDASTVFCNFFLDFGVRFCVAGAVFGEVGG